MACRCRRSVDVKCRVQVSMSMGPKRRSFESSVATVSLSSLFSSLLVEMILFHTEELLSQSLFAFVLVIFPNDSLDMYSSNGPAHCTLFGNRPTDVGEPRRSVPQVFPLVIFSCTLFINKLVAAYPLLTHVLSIKYRASSRSGAVPHIMLFISNGDEICNNALLSDESPIEAEASVVVVVVVAVEHLVLGKES